MFTLWPLSPFYAVGLTFLIAFLCTGLATWYARKSGMLDHPGERHSHTVITPRGGGAGLIVAFLIASLFWSGPESSGAWVNGILPGILLMASVGAWDDHEALSVRFRLFVQLAVSIGFVWYAHGAGWVQGVIPLAVSGLFVVWMTNMYNFMDGSNGMAAMQGVFASSLLAGLFFISGDLRFALICLFLAASCCGFLPWNLGDAKVFMGDVGSLALGFTFAALMLYGLGTGVFGIPVASLVMLLFLTDSTLTLTTRVIRGERWYNPHRQHLYQRLIAHGWTHGRVAVLYQLINLVLILPGVVFAVRYPMFAGVIALASIIICALGWYFSIRRFEGPVEAG